MTVERLLAYLEGFYGEKYSGAVLDLTAGYLEGKSGAYCDAALSVLVKRFSRTWGKVPCPAEFEKYEAEIIEAMPVIPSLPEPDKKILSHEEIAGYFRRWLEKFEEKYVKCKPCKNCKICPKKEPGPMAGKLAKTFGKLKEQEVCDE